MSVTQSRQAILAAACAVLLLPAAGLSLAQPPSDPPQQETQQQETQLDGEPSGRTARIGETIADFTLADCRGKDWNTARDFAQTDVMVVAFLGVECPLVRLYARRLQELHERYGARVTLVGVNSNQQDSLTEIAHFVRTNELTFPLLKDPGNVVADRFGAKRTPELFVLDKQRRLRYHGRIDDQYTYGIQRPEVTKNYLQAAVEQMLAGKSVAAPETEVVGCFIGRKLQPRADSPVTYSDQISRILQKRCVECHRQGEIAPFALTDYDEVVGWAEMIAEVVDQQRMPPWHANPKHGAFANNASLGDEEKQLIFDWVDAGAPQGDPARLPPPRKFVEGWRIGEPDLVVPMSKQPFQVPAEGEVKYQYFVVDPGFEEDKWIQAAECRPGNREVVHHIIVAARPPGGAARRAHGTPQSVWLAATAPGAEPLQLDDGMAKRIPARARLVFQMHYTPNGRPQSDLSSVGFIFADPGEVRREVLTQQAANHAFRIPPGAANHRVQSTFTFRDDSLLISMFPHMHLRGKAFRYTAVYPDQSQEVLLDIPAYDFNWQNSYRFAEPKSMPKGTKLECVAHFDNSPDNLANPDPKTSVRWGDQTWDEMMIGYFDMCLAEERSPAAKRRTDQFLDRVGGQPAPLPATLKQAAQSSLASAERLESLAAAVREIAPQVDRVDWVYVENGELHVALVAERRRARRVGGGQGAVVPAKRMALAEYAAGEQTVVNQDITRLPNGDMLFMRRSYTSGLHIPRRIDGKQGVVSFWSSERKAFPPPAVELLESVAKLVDRPKSSRAEE